LVQYPRVLRLPKNTAGRDFVVGDIHGSFQLLDWALLLAKFNPRVDRLFMTGDFIDRGYLSKNCAKYLRRKGVFSVRGNHEQHLIDLYHDGEPTAATLAAEIERYSMEWWEPLPVAARQQILRAVRKLPFAIEIETDIGLVGIVHAEVPPRTTWQGFLKQLDANDSQAIESCIWSRRRFKDADCSGVRGVERVFVGHNISDHRIRSRGNVFMVDTGAVYGANNGPAAGHLSLINIISNPEAITKPAKLRHVINVIEP
jgi:serine/threonine protein phosphatase 1